MEVLVKKLVIGLVAAAGVALATPAMSQFYIGAGPGGVGIGVGPGPGYYDGGPRYRRSYRSYGYDRGARCRTRWVETRRGMRRVTRCW